MIEELKKLKEKIMCGATTETDVDTINKTIAYIRKLEEKAAGMVQIPSQKDFCMEPNSVNVSIQNATINIYTQENK